MRVLHLSSGISTQSAAYRLHLGLIKLEVESKIYVCYNPPNDNTVLKPQNNFISKLKVQLDRLPLTIYKNRNSLPFNVGLVKNFSIDIIKNYNPDIIHLHWVSQFVSIDSLKEITDLGIPVFWTMHDSWALTGGCHIPYPCEKFFNQCHQCPQLKSESNHDLSYYLFNKKKKWKDLPLNIIAPSKWMYNNLKQSCIFKDSNILHIPNYINSEMFNKVDKRDARIKFQLPLDKKIVLFGANNATKDINKGYGLLISAFNILRAELNDVVLVLFGNDSTFVNENDSIIALGYITNPEDFKYLYSAADVTVNASISENYSNVILESITCETPVVAFDIGGNSDFSNIFLAKPFDVNDMAQKIRELLTVHNSKKINPLLSNSIEIHLNEYTKFLKP